MQPADTIVALSTHPGRAAIAVVRLSGPAAGRILSLLFDRARTLEQRPPATAVHGHISNAAGERLDEVVITRFQAPHSYTGEQMLEISCHGSAYIVEQLLAACCELGARPAEPGEFTRRAFLNDKLDLTGAESVEALINATTAFAHRNALIHLEGRLHERLREMRREIIDLYALLEAELDFSDEEITPAPDAELARRLDGLFQAQGELLASYRLGKLAGGAQVVITGPTNVGKSTLMNQLLREDRVIVTPESGTTRDAVSADIDIRGIRITLWDTAGIRDTDNAVEKEGILRTRRAIDRADVVIQMHDCSQADTDADRTQAADPDAPVVEVWNKCDLREGWQPPAGQLAIVATDGTGIDDLLTAVYDRLTGGEALPHDAVLLTNLRHYQLLREAKRHLQDVSHELSAGVERSLLVIGLRDAAEAVGKIDGSFDIEEVLDSIFSRFCIGK